MEKSHLQVLPEGIRNKFELVLEGRGALGKETRKARDESNERQEYTALHGTGV